MKTKLLSVILAVSAAFSGISAFAEADEDIISTSVKDLSELGIVNGYEDGDFRQNDYLTKGEAAKMVRYMMNHEDSDGGLVVYTQSENGQILQPGEEKKPSHWSSRNIELLSAIGVIDRYEEGDFNPDENITCSELCKMVIRLLGYKEDAEVKDKDTYMLQSYWLGLIDDLGFNQDRPYYDYISDITRGSAAVVISKALDIPRKLVYEYSMKDGFKRKIYEKNTFRNIIKSNELFDEQDRVKPAGREILNFTNKVIYRFSDSTSFDVNLSENESGIAVSFNEKWADYCDYYISMARYEKGSVINGYCLTRVGPFAAPDLKITGLEPSSEYSFSICAAPTALMDISGSLIAVSE